jgi:hypothetical protein
MNGNNKEEIKKLWAKSIEFAECIHTGQLTCFDAWYALTSTVMKTLEYPIATTTINKDEWSTRPLCLLLWWRLSRRGNAIFST